MINILYIIDCYKDPYAGTEGQLLKLINGLDRKRFNPLLVILRGTYYREGDGDTLFCEIPIQADILNIGRLSSAKTWLTLYKYLRRKKRERFVIAHTYFYDSAIICPPILKMLGYKVVVSRRDMGYWYTQKVLWVLRLNRVFVDHVVANSLAVKNITVQHEGYSGNSIRVIYNGYKELDNNATSSRIDIPLRERDIRIVLVANIRPIKRITDAIIAIALISEVMSDVVLYIIGDGDSADLEAAVSQYGVNEKVHILGPRDNILELLPKFDIGVLCSESEGFSNTIIEYLQSGLPVVCSRVGGNPEIIEHGVNGFLYDAGDVRALTSYILALAKSEALRKEMGEAGRKIVESHYNLRKYITNHEKLYEELISGNRDA